MHTGLSYSHCPVLVTTQVIEFVSALVHATVEQAGWWARVLNVISTRTSTR